MKRVPPRSRSDRRTAKALPPPFIPPYPPSWLDHLTRRIDQLPGPYWSPYLAAYLALLGLAWLLLGLEGRPLSAETVFAHAVPYYGFWLLHYLDRRAAVSLEEYRPAFTGREDEVRQIRWRLTTLPSRPALIVTVVALGISLAVSLSWGFGSPFSVLDRLQFYAADVFAGLYAYHSIRQLRLVNRLYASSTRVDLHDVTPLRSFSTLSAHTAVGGLLILSAGVLITPDGFVGPFLPAGIAFAVLAVLAFVLPLMGLHRRLVRAKDQELADLARRWQTCMAEVYRRLDRGDLNAAEQVQSTLNALEKARAVVERIPTWPWRAESLRSLVAALVLPVVISMIQYGLRRFFG